MYNNWYNPQAGASSSSEASGNTPSWVSEGGYQTGRTGELLIIFLHRWVDPTSFELEGRVVFFVDIVKFTF